MGQCVQSIQVHGLQLGESGTVDWYPSNIRNYGSGLAETWKSQLSEHTMCCGMSSVNKDLSYPATPITLTAVTKLLAPLHVYISRATASTLSLRRWCPRS